MKQYFSLVALLVILLIGCQKQAEQKESISISIEKNEILLICGESTEVPIIGTAEYCTAETDDNFVASAYGGDGKIEVEGMHVGQTRITIKSDAAENEIECLVTVLPSFDYVGGVTALWGASREDVNASVDRTNLLKSYYNEQRGCVTFSYQIGTYFIVTMYYYSDGKLCGIHKTVEAPSDTETTAYINISNSMGEYMEFVSGSSSSGRIYKHPSGYYAVLYTPHLNETYDIYYAPTLEDAKNHPFTR